jgi:hypothetical protein
MAVLGVGARAPRRLRLDKVEQILPADGSLCRRSYDDRGVLYTDGIPECRNPLEVEFWNEQISCGS